MKVIITIISVIIFNPIIWIFVAIIILKRKFKANSGNFGEILKELQKQAVKNNENNLGNDLANAEVTNGENLQINNFQSIMNVSSYTPTTLKKRTKYLHIALNSTLEEAREIISLLPVSDRILIEVGTPLIKIYGADAITRIKRMAPAGTYVVADNKCADLASREVEMMANAGANAATCLGVAPIETIDSFNEECRKYNIDSMIDMMNVDNPLLILKQLKTMPTVVMLHRGVDESEFAKEKQIPYYQIKQIKGSYNIIVAVAGGDTIKEIERAIFNDADIVVVWKSFYGPSTETANLAKSFLKEI